MWVVLATLGSVGAVWAAMLALETVVWVVAESVATVGAAMLGTVASHLS